MSLWSPFTSITVLLVGVRKEPLDGWSFVIWVTYQSCRHSCRRRRDGLVCGRESGPRKRLWTGQILRRPSMTLFTRCSGSSQCLETGAGGTVDVLRLPLPSCPNPSSLVHASSSGVLSPSCPHCSCFLCPIIYHIHIIHCLYLTVTNNFIWYKKVPIFCSCVRYMLTLSLPWTWFVLGDGILYCIYY